MYGFWIRIDIIARSLIPFMLTLALVILGQVPNHITGFDRMMPMLALISIYYWSIYRPDLMPMLLVFLLGFLQDILSGSPLGLHSFLFLIGYALVGSQRRFFLGNSFGIVWWGFMLVCAIVAILEWLLSSLIGQQFLSPMPAIFSYLFSMAAFPILAVPMLVLHRLLPQHG